MTIVSDNVVWVALLISASHGDWKCDLNGVRLCGGSGGRIFCEADLECGGGDF